MAMLRTGLLAAVFTAQLIHALPDEQAKSRLSSRSVGAFAPAAPLGISENVLSLQRTNVKSASSAALRARVLANSSTTLAPVLGGVGYAVKVDFGGTEVLLDLDTGSSDIWVARHGVTCIGDTMQPVPEKECMFGPLYNGTFEEGSIANETFASSYGDNEVVLGTLGYADVTIANMTVKHQEVALVEYAYWQGDNVTSGLAGFAYPAITGAYHDPSKDNRKETQATYDPFVTSAIKQGLFTSFSIALERGANGGGGYLALGGLPPIPFNHTFTSTPIKITELNNVGNTSSQLSFYTIEPEAFVISGGLEAGKKTQLFKPVITNNADMIVDSGTTLMYVPTSVAMKVNSLFDPPAKYVHESGVYETDCDAKVPNFAIRIGGTDFHVNSEDLLLTGKDGYDPYTGGCITGVQATSEPPYILGDTFLKNVVAVFDVGAGEMRFAPHVNY